MTAGKLRETKMKKILLLLIIFYSSMTISYAEKLPENLVEILSGGPETYVPYRQYFAEYTDRLSQAFEPKGKFPWRTFIFTDLRYLIHKDGSIIGRYRAKKASPKLDKYVTEIIKNNPPKPFLDGMDYEVIRIYIQSGYYKKADKISYMINGADFYNASTKKYYPPEFTIYLIHDSRKIFK